MSASAPIHPAIRREFLGWDRPALPEAARRLGQRYRNRGTLDLSTVIVVVPGQRAGRRLQELLAFLGEDDKLRLTPPIVVTEGLLPEMLYTPKLPFANNVAQDLAWAQALRDLPADKRRHVVPHPPDAENTLGWLELAKVLRRLHVELAADGLDFAAVLTKGPKLDGFREAQRWDALVCVQRRYLELLDREKLWDIQTARLKAIEFREIKTDCDIVLLGTVDLNNSLRQMLDQTAEKVTAYIVAPENLADRFDPHGCLVASTWCDAEIAIREEQLRQVDGPTEQADAVTAWLAELGGRFRNDEIAIGVPDEALVPQLQRQLKQSNVNARWVEGTRIGESAPYRLLAAAVEFAGRRRYDDFAKLLRHPDVEEWLQSGLPNDGIVAADDGTAIATSLPAQLDRYYCTHLPNTITASRSLDNRHDWPDLAAALERVDEWIAEASANHPLRKWGELFRKMLGAVYGCRTLLVDKPDDEVLHRIFRRVLEECERLDDLPERLDASPLSAADAFELALGPLADEALPPPADAEAVEILGWLELPLDDSRAVVVTSFNEGFVPQSAGADAFLPDGLRRELGLLHNERRYARDAYAASVLSAGREELRIVFGRRDAKDDPLQPSRLLFACPDKIMIGRASRFFAGAKPPSAPRRLLLAGKGAITSKSRFTVPEPWAKTEKELERVSVTEFKHYLACPYRYYLRRIREIKVVNDAARELEPSTFGNLLHQALSAFGRDAAAPRQSVNPRDIFDYLVAQLADVAERIYGSDRRRPAIRLQLEQAKRRLGAFAAQQAKLTKEGWRIVYAEDISAAVLSASWTVDDSPITLVGRIDRIDFHESAKKIRVLDFKTADTAQSPDKTHRKDDEWVDLQLPLYRHLWPAATKVRAVDCTVELAYFNLPKTIDDTEVSVARWDPGLLEEADEMARRVIRGLRDEEFWPPVSPPPPYSDDFAAICLDNMLSGPALGEGDQGGAE